MNIILYAIPGFFILIGLELLAEKIRGTNYYRVNDSIASLSTGVLSQLSKVVALLVPFTIYISVFDNFAVFQVKASPVSWVITFVLYDFFYYWAHRIGHEVSIFWAAHVLHHSSEEYNLTTALRQTSTGWLSFVFFIPMALAGFPPAMIITVGAVNLIYQYWVHTRHIGDLGWYELVFVTPSNHRVHHAQNKVYIDRNYGGVFILWDRFFGTYQQELDDQPVIFGIRGALKSWNPLWANLQFYNQLFQDCLHTKSWWYKITLWFRRTGWRPPDVIGAYPLLKTDLDHFSKFHTQLSPGLKIYAIVQYVINTALALALLLNLSALSGGQQLAVIAFIMLSSYSLGAVMELASFGLILEVLKHSLLIIALLVFFPLNWMVGLILLLSVCSILATQMKSFRQLDPVL
jgi:sterol desaturase/sphingolipid hydroxylase (fatty acid hydroxylase superfamily)